MWTGEEESQEFDLFGWLFQEYKKKHTFDSEETKKGWKFK